MFCSLSWLLASSYISGPEEGQVARAKVLTEDLLLVVRSEHAKMQALLNQQQMELHQAQTYAAYSNMAVGSLLLTNNSSSLLFLFCANFCDLIGLSTWPATPRWLTTAASIRH